MAVRTRRRNASGHVDPFFQRRVRFDAALRVLGLNESFARMPRRMQEVFWRSKWPDPVLVFDDAYRKLERTAMGTSLRALVEHCFREAFIEINAQRVKVRDFLTIIHGCSALVKETLRLTEGKEIQQEVGHFLNSAREPLQRCCDENMLKAFQSLHFSVLTPLVAHSRLDTRQFTARLKLEQVASGKFEQRVIVGAERARVRDARLDGASRAVYRVASIAGADGVQWLELSSEQLGEAGPPRKYPVYVQTHALRQLRQRVNLPRAEPFLESWLATSIAEPNIVQRQGETLLIEYRIRNFRLGYLVATLLKDEGGLVVVRTFKFLTMEQTPEARLLEERLRLTRRDLDWLGLSDLAAFTQTDLRNDAVLRAMLEECGCGHLFELVETPLIDAGDLLPDPKPIAADLRRYLCMAA